MGKLVFPVILVIAVGIMVGLFMLGDKNKPPADPNIISRSGVHWHPELKIYVKGKEQPIAQNIGIGAQHQEVHTHADLPQIHYEMAGPVTKQEASLGAFFKNWSKTFEGKLTMTVNGQPNSENLNYVVKDKDKIELRYE